MDSPNQQDQQQQHQTAAQAAAAVSHSQPEKPKGTGFFRPMVARNSCGRSVPSNPKRSRSSTSLGCPTTPRASAAAHHHLQPTHSSSCRGSLDGSRGDAGMQQSGQVRPLQPPQASPFALAQMAGQHILAPCSAGAQQQPLFSAASALSGGLTAPQRSCSSSSASPQLPGAWTGHHQPADSLLLTVRPGVITAAPAACNLTAPVHIDSSALCGTHLAAACGGTVSVSSQLPAALVVGPAAPPAPVLAGNAGMMQAAGGLCASTASTAGGSVLFMQPPGCVLGGPAPTQHQQPVGAYTAPAAGGQLLSGQLSALSGISPAQHSGQLTVDQIALCHAQHRGEQLELAQQQDDIQQQIDQLHLLQQLLHIRKQHKLQHSMCAQAQQQQQHGQFVSAPHLQLLAGGSIDSGSGAILQPHSASNAGLSMLAAPVPAAAALAVPLQQQQQQLGGLSLSGGISDAVLAALLQQEPQQYMLAQQQQQQQMGALLSEPSVAGLVAPSTHAAASGWQQQQQQQQWMAVHRGQLPCTTTNSVLLSGSRLGP